MKKASDIFFIIIIFFVIYFLQSNFFAWFTISGVMPNLFVILSMLIGLFIKKKISFVMGLIFGLLLDLFIGFKIGPNAISLSVVALCAEALDHFFSKDNRITIMFFTFILTLIAEIVVYILQVLFCSVSLQVLEFTKIILIEASYNSALIAIIYPVFFILGNKLESDFMSNRFLKFWK